MHANASKEIPRFPKYLLALLGYTFGVIHKPRGQKFGYFDPNPSWSLVLNNADGMKWSYD